MEPAYAQINTNAASVTPAPPSTDENLARALGHLDRAFKVVDALEQRLFGETPGNMKGEPSMPDAVCWKANALGNETDRLADRLGSILQRL